MGSQGVALAERLEILGWAMPKYGLGGVCGLL